MESQVEKGSPPPPPSLSTETFLNRKKKEIVDRSMALFQSKLNVCLDNTASAPGKRPSKRARDDDDGGGSSPSKTQSLEVTTRATRKKRVKRDETEVLYACPFYKHNPTKYKHVKTCCGPGWPSVHRVKEHVYRSHSSKNYCQRCMEHFESGEELQEHCQSEKPCKLIKNKTADFCSDAKEKSLRARIKSGLSEEEKWQDMYKMLFPGEKVPSPHYDSSDETSATPQKSRFKNDDEIKDHLRVHLPRLVRPLMERYVDELFQDIQERVNRKAQEIVRDVEIQVLRTFHCLDDSNSPGTPVSLVEKSDDKIRHRTTDRHRSSSPSTVFNDGSRPPEMEKINEYWASLRADPGYTSFSNNLTFDIEGILAENQNLIGANLSDSGFFSTSDNGGDYYGSASVMMPPYPQHLS
ncbi:hypothetical protein QBC35DRAFT_296604 [Podospora australis]|uniref:C2H2-type domain-containing protein n=1 Tax=Podospora australis TaxID=1536484 RepID=A0AAN7AEP2_9PEZI|nr:hypothetical protein QBC35DRAFT_296604 [Podospora australis]